MHKPIYIYRSRHNIYYFRWPIPAYLHPEGKTEHVKVSLGTREPKEALRLASFLEYHALLITQHGNLVYMDYADIRKAVQGYLSKALRERKAEIDRQGPYSASQIAGLASSAALISQAIEYDDNTLIEPLIPQERIHAVSEEYSLGIMPNTPQYKILEDVLRIGLRDLTREVLSQKINRNLRSIHHSEHQPPSGYGYGSVYPLNA